MGGQRSAAHVEERPVVRRGLDRRVALQPAPRARAVKLAVGQHAVGDRGRRRELMQPRPGPAFLVVVVSAAIILTLAFVVVRILRSRRAARRS